MTEKERLRNWLDDQIVAKNGRRVETDNGEQIENMEYTHDDDVLFVYNTAELVRILGETLIIEDREGVKMNKRVYFEYRGYKIYDIFTA